jgi:hypothetical protein
MMKTMFLTCWMVCTCFVATGAETNAVTKATDPILKHSDVVFMYAADEKAYKAYGATFVAWGGASTTESVRMHHKLGIRCTGTMWCLTAGARTLYENAELREAVARDIEGKPIEVPWQFDHTYKDMKTYFGCTNHPAFRAHARQQVEKAMAGGADGLHVDDHLGVAQAATSAGGGLCDYCIAGFRDYLKKHATREQLDKAGVRDLDKFDYRDLIRQYATTRDEYRKVQNKIPLMDLFRQYHLEAAADFVRELGEVGARAAAHPILLSANAGLPDKRHAVVVKYLTHVVCEVGFNASQGTAKPERAIEAFDMARSLGKPLAATASGQDWAHVKATNSEELVRFWIAFTYAHGQRFMAPHPTRQWCFTRELGTHWYQAPVEAYAPLYRFIRANAKWFDAFETMDSSAIQATSGVIVTARRKGETGPIVLHAINRDYDAKSDRMRPAKNLQIRLPSGMLTGLRCDARLLSYDSEPQTAKMRTEGAASIIALPELRLWTLVSIE